MAIMAAARLGERQHTRCGAAIGATYQIYSLPELFPLGLSGSFQPRQRQQTLGVGLDYVSQRDTYGAMIKSFRGSAASSFARLILEDRQAPKGFSGNVARVARRKLVQLNNAVVIGDLAAPPGNRLEALGGDLAGKHSIRVNNRWRVVFRWTTSGPEEVEIVDYHR
jgi:proteic killer suppression protein